MLELNPYESPQTVEELEALNYFENEPPGPHNYASRWKRLFGALIDGILAIILILTIDLIVEGGNSLVLSWMDSDFEESSWLDRYEGMILGYVAYAAMQFHFWRTRGQSIGKMLVGTRIVTLDGNQARIGRISIMREGVMYFLTYIPIIGNFISLIDLLMIFRGGRNTLRDDIAITRVIRAHRVEDSQQP